MVVVRDLDASLRFHRDGIGLDLLLDRNVEGDWPELLDAPSRRLRGAGPVIANVIPVHTAQIMERSTPIRSHCQHERWPCQIGDKELGGASIPITLCDCSWSAASPQVSAVRDGFEGWLAVRISGAEPDVLLRPAACRPLVAMVAGCVL